MRGRHFLQAADQFAIELARERHKAFRLVELALLAPIERRICRTFTETLRMGLLHRVRELQRLVFLKVGFLHGHAFGSRVFKFMEAALYAANVGILARASMSSLVRPDSRSPIHGFMPTR